MTQIYFLSLLIACGEKDTEDTAVDPATEPSTEASTEPSGEPATEPSSEASTEPSGEPATEPSSEASTEPSAEASTEPAGEPSGEPEDISIEGTWSNDSETYVIANDSLSTTTVWGDETYGPYNYSVTQYSNADMYIIASSEADENGDFAWNRFDWVMSDDNSLYICNTVYDATSEEEALAATPADATDPANGGCGGFSWSALTAQ